MRKCLFALVVLTYLPFAARAWNSLGHQAVAELVWRQMNAAERQAASDLLRQHPHYQQMLLADVLAGADTNEWAFLNASVWLDRVRPAKPGEPAKPLSITKYDIYPHAIGYPFVHPADRNRLSLEKFFIAKPNAEMVLSNAIVTLGDRNASAHDRAVSLCVVLHLCGDLHQPLHASNLVTERKPNGNDLGGSLFVLNSKGERLSMHALWDRLPGLDLSPKAVLALADQLASAPELKPTQMKEYQAHKTIASWVQEGFRVAVDFAYAEERVQYVEAADIKSGAVAAPAIPVLKDDYLREARQIAHCRLALAAQRLSDQLNHVWESCPPAR